MNKNSLLYKLSTGMTATELLGEEKVKETLKNDAKEVGKLEK